MNDLGNVKNLKSISFDRATNMTLYEGKNSLVDKAKKRNYSKRFRRF
jgi:hypothetical protein